MKCKPRETFAKAHDGIKLNGHTKWTFIHFAKKIHTSTIMIKDHTLSERNFYRPFLKKLTVSHKTTSLKIAVGQLLQTVF